MDNFTYWSPQQVVSSGRYPLSIGQVRHLLLFRHKNGLSEAGRKIGKRVMFRVDLLDHWVEQHKEERYE
jgi:hypothetical protein